MEVVKNIASLSCKLKLCNDYLVDYLIFQLIKRLRWRIQWSFSRLLDLQIFFSKSLSLTRTMLWWMLLRQFSQYTALLYEYHIFKNDIIFALFFSSSDVADAHAEAPSWCCVRSTIWMDPSEMTFPLHFYVRRRVVF